MAVNHTPARPRWARAFPSPTRLHLAVAAAVAVTASLAVSDAQARITSISVTQTESPTFGGFSWPEVGQYEKIVGVAYGEIDPNDPKNAVITDIALAPRNAARQRRVRVRLLHPEADRPEARATTR